MHTEIIICTERGHLEPMAKLLLSSIRAFGGAWRDARIFSYCPRPGHAPGGSTLDFFARHGVEYVDLPLNVDFPDYPLANKPLACAHRESESSADLLIFLDTDTVFLGPPDVLSEVRSGEVWMRPVDMALVGATPDFSGENGAYWQALYDELKVVRRQTVTTTVDAETILEYYNSGMVITHRANGLFRSWSANFRRVWQLGLHPPDGPFYVEQSVLSATIAALDLTVRQLPGSFNYPVHLLDEWPSPPEGHRELMDKSHLHYHREFQQPLTARPLKMALAKFPTGRTLNKMIRASGVEPDPVGYYLSAAVRKVRRLVWGKRV